MAHNWQRRDFQNFHDLAQQVNLKIQKIENWNIKTINQVATLTQGPSTKISLIRSQWPMETFKWWLALIEPKRLPIVADTEKWKTKTFFNIIFPSRYSPASNDQWNVDYSDAASTMSENSDRGPLILDWVRKKAKTFHGKKSLKVRRLMNGKSFLAPEHSTPNFRFPAKRHKLMPRWCSMMNGESFMGSCCENHNRWF